MNGQQPATVATVNAKPDCAPLGGSADGSNTPILSMPYVIWRLLYWAKIKTMSYEQIDTAVVNGELIPRDSQVE